MSRGVSTAVLGRQLWTFSVASAEPLARRLGLPLRAARQPFAPPATIFTRGIRVERALGRVPRNNGRSTRKSFAGSGLLLIGLSTDAPASPSLMASCSAGAEAALFSSACQGSSTYKAARQAWQRSLHTSARTEFAAGATRRSPRNERPDKTPEKVPPPPQSGPKTEAPPEPAKNPTAAEQESITASVSKYLHIPHMLQRPSKEELLAAANGFWERLKVRFKWASIRSMRPWNIDEWGAFISWVLFGHLVWILVGTTTFFSLLIYSINTVFAQETLARWIGDYLTQSAGVTVVFESAIVPKWKDGVISFTNVFVSRRPGQIESSVSKGSSTNAAAVAAAGRSSEPETQLAEVDEGNYTQFDVTIATVNVTLSFIKWWNGKGLLKDVEVKGVRGVVDRTSVHWSGEGIDPLSYRHTHQPGDFEIDSFKMEDLLLSIYQPHDFRPFTMSIYSCELPRLRKQWLFYDFLSANHISGSFDGSLFTIHPRQVHGSLTGDDANNLGDPSVWKKSNRLRIDGLRIDHLNRGVEGPFGWIYEGNVDIVADLMLPLDPDESIGKVMSDFYDQLEDLVTSNRIKLLSEAVDAVGADEDTASLLLPTGHISQASFVEEPHPEPTAASPSQTEGTEPPSSSPPPAEADEEDRRFLVMDLRIHLNDVKAAVPLFSRDISYVNQALVRPIVAYINARKTYIPITCRIVKRASDFDGSWTVYDCGLMHDLSAETYEAFARDVEDQRNRVRRLRKVGFWTLSLAVHALFMGMAGNVM